mgnify:FL=1
MKTGKIIRFSLAIVIGLVLVAVALMADELYPGLRSKEALAAGGAAITAAGIYKLCVVLREKRSGGQ